MVGHAIELGDGLSSAGDTNFIKSYNEARLDTLIPFVTPWATRNMISFFELSHLAPIPKGVWGGSCLTMTWDMEASTTIRRV